MRISNRCLMVLLACAATLARGYAQPAPANPVSQGQRAPVQPEVLRPDVQLTAMSPDYLLGSGDQIQLQVTPEAEELTGRVFRIDNEGNLVLPLAGVVKASGRSPKELEAAVARRLEDYIRSPQVSVTVTQYRTDPVFLTGMFARPGVHPLYTSRKLIEVLSTAGGILPNASRRIRITRRLEYGAIPLPTAVVDEAGKISNVEISLTRLMATPNAVENIDLAPYDVLYVAREEMVYLNIEGVKAGAYPLDDRDFISVVQLIALAGGMTPGLAPEKARVLRPILDTSRRAEIPIDVAAILAGRQNDYPLMPNDLLLIPRSGSVKTALTRPLAFMVPAVVTSLIWASLR